MERKIIERTKNEWQQKKHVGSWLTAECQVGSHFCKQQHCMFWSHHSSMAGRQNKQAKGDGDERKASCARLNQRLTDWANHISGCTDYKCCRSKTEEPQRPADQSINYFVTYWKVSISSSLNLIKIRQSCYEHGWHLQVVGGFHRISIWGTT